MIILTLKGKQNNIMIFFTYRKPHVNKFKICPLFCQTC